MAGCGFVWTKFRNTITIGLFISAIATALSSSAIGADSNTPSLKRLAIISSKDVQDSGLSDLLTAKMGELKNIELVERDMLAKVTDEIAISNMLGADQTENRRKAGTILRADVLVLFSIEKIEIQMEDQNNASMFGENSGHHQPKKGLQIRKSVKVVISDCASGARLRIAGVDFNDKNMPNTCEEALKIISGTLTQFEKGINQIIGVSHFISKSLVHDYDRYQAGFAYLLENAISSYPGIAVIEIEEARNIRVENQLKDDSRIKRLVPLFVEGEYEFKNNGSEGKVKLLDISVTVSDNNGVIKKVSKKDLSFDRVGEFLTSEAAGGILGLTKISAIKTFDVNGQFNALAKRADEFSRLGGWEHSTGLREAAILLKPDSAGQRTTLIKEYWRINAPWKIKHEHLEYLISNKKIGFWTASHLWELVFSGPFKSDYEFTSLGLTTSDYSCDIWFTEFPKLLELDVNQVPVMGPSNPAYVNFWKLESYSRWYGLFMHGFFSDVITKDDFSCFVRFHNELVPDQVSFSSSASGFINFISYNLRKDDEKRRQFHLAMYPNGYSEQDFFDFITVLSKSQKKLACLYGRYGLLWHEYEMKKSKDETMDDLYLETKKYIADFEKYALAVYIKYYYNVAWNKRKETEIPTSIPYMSALGLRGFVEHNEELLRKIRNNVSEEFKKTLIVSEANETAKSIIDKRIIPKKPDTPKSIEKSGEPNGHIIKGRLVFNKVPVKFKTKEGLITDIEQGGIVILGYSHQLFLNNAIKCGDSLDVFWGSSHVYFMKEKGMIEEVFFPSDFRDQDIGDVVWCGKYIWVGIRGNNEVWILDTTGKIAGKIDSNDGLPPANAALRICPIEPGKILAVGSFKPLNRGWCAILECHDGKTAVNVFHKATRVTLQGDKDLYLDPNAVFIPRWIHEYHGFQEKERLFLIAQERIPSFKNTIYPLSVNVNEPKVKIFPWDLTETKVSYLHFMYLKPEAYFSKNGVFFCAHKDGIWCFAAAGKTLPGRNTVFDIICKDSDSNNRNREVLAGYLIENNGWLYSPGEIWFRFDPNTLKEEKLLSKPLPLCKLEYHWLSAHYGLAGWDDRHTFYQIEVTDKEHDVMAESIKSYPEKDKLYYHTIVFEDDNGPITEPNLLKSIHISIDVRFGAYRGWKGYDYAEWFKGGYFPAGMFQVNSLYKVQTKQYESVTKYSGRMDVNKESPERLTFKLKVEKNKIDKEADILYAGKVINALTGSPMADVNVIVKKNYFDNNPIVIRTNSEGRYEISYKLNAPLDSFKTASKNFYNIEVSNRQFGQSKDGKVEIPVIKLFPAAYVKVYPCIEIYNSGKPCDESYNYNCWLAFRGIQYDSKDASKFLESIGRNDSYIIGPKVTMNTTVIYEVPAGIDFSLEFTTMSHDEFCIPKISKSFKLNQGETVDLGRLVFEPAIKIIVKALDSKGDSVKGLPVRREYINNPFHNVKYEYTDEGGRAMFYVEPNSPAIFKYVAKAKDWNSEKSVTFQIGGRDCNNKEYILQVPDDIVNQLKK